MYARLVDNDVPANIRSACRHSTTAPLRPPNSIPYNRSVSYRNVCDCESYPLLKTINRVLGRLPGPGPDCYLDEQRNDLDGVVIENTEIGFTGEMGREQCTEPLLRGHSTDCNKYVICEFGMLLEQSCPSQLHFNKVTKCSGDINICLYRVSHGAPLNMIKSIGFTFFIGVNFKYLILVFFFWNSCDHYL